MACMQMQQRWKCAVRSYEEVLEEWILLRVEQHLPLDVLYRRIPL